MQDSDYFAKLNLFVDMAYYVAKVLHQRPNEILDTWGVPELIVAFGQYANKQSKKNYEEWKSLDAKTRAHTPKPNEYVVYFHDIKAEIEE